MNKRVVAGWALTALIALSGVAYGDDRPSHFKGLPAETLKDAVKNFSEHNGKLEALLNQGELSPEDLATIHQLTYTLENALNKINSEFEALAETLEEVHVASEHADAETVVNKGREYLSVSRQVID